MTALTHLLQVKPLLFEPGDSMGQEEFLSRWERMPELRFAELIKGMVYMPSPVSAAHSRKHGVLLARQHCMPGGLPLSKSCLRPHG